MTRLQFIKLLSAPQGSQKACLLEDGDRRGLCDMREEEECDAVSATCERRRSSSRPQQPERGGGVQLGLTNMSEEEEFDATLGPLSGCLHHKGYKMACGRSLTSDGSSRQEVAAVAATLLSFTFLW